MHQKKSCNIVVKFAPILGLMAISGCHENLCGSVVTLQKPSPNLDQAIIWVSKDCGATTAPLTSVYVVPTSIAEGLDVEVPKISKNYQIYSYQRGEWDVQWASQDSILVRYDFSPKFRRTGSFFSQKNNVGDVLVNYQDMSERNE